MPQKNRELSQFGSFLEVDNVTKNIGIATTGTPFVGIGTTNPTSKLHVVGDTTLTGGANVTGIVSASAFYINGSPLVDVSIQEWSSGTGSNIYRQNGNVGIGTSNSSYKLDVAGDINFNGSLYQNKSPFVASRWTSGGANDIYKLDGNVGIGTSTLTQKLTVNGNVSAGQFISTVLTGTSPFTIQSETQVDKLNASFLRGGVPGQDTNSNDIVTRGGTQTLTNKTLTSPTISTILNSGEKTVPAGVGTFVITGPSGSGLITSDMIANGTIVNTDVATNAAIEYGKLSLSNSISNSDISSSAAIAYSKLFLSNSIVNGDIVNSTITNAKLANSTISGVSLGSNLATLSFGNFIQVTGGSSYNGSTAVSIAISASTISNGTIVLRDSSGNFNAGTITANLSGNVTGNVTGTATGLSGTPNLNVGVVTATRLVGVGSFSSLNVTGVSTLGIVTATSLNDSIGNVRSIPQNSQNTTYTLSLTDVGKYVNITGGSGVVIPTNIFSSGDAISIFNNTAFSKTVTPNTGVTLRLAGTALTGGRTLTQYSLSTIICISSNVFAITGAGVT